MYQRLNLYPSTNDINTTGFEKIRVKICTKNANMVIATYKKFTLNAPENVESAPESQAELHIQGSTQEYCDKT
jgi:hypothetical protein